MPDLQPVGCLFGFPKILLSRAIPKVKDFRAGRQAVCVTFCPSCNQQQNNRVNNRITQLTKTTN